MKKAILLLFVSCVAFSLHAEFVFVPSTSTPDGEAGGHEYVDLGLPSGTLWATSNINAEELYLAGDYFAWGETHTRGRFIWTEYEFFEEEYTDDNGLRNYSATDIGEQISGTEYDAARCLWGEGWRIPTKEDWEELISCCQTEYRQIIYGSVNKSMVHLIGPNGNSMMLPETFSPHGGVTIERHCGEYWTATSCSEMTDGRYPSALMVFFAPTSNVQFSLMPYGRHDGLSIRPVISHKDVPTSVTTLTEVVPAIKYENGAISITGNADGCELTISDMSGRKVCTFSCRCNIWQMPQLEKGVYVASLSKGAKTLSTRKIAVK